MIKPPTLSIAYREVKGTLYSVLYLKCSFHSISSKPHCRYHLFLPPQNFGNELENPIRNTENFMNSQIMFQVDIFIYNKIMFGIIIWISTGPVLGSRAFTPNQLSTLLSSQSIHSSIIIFCPKTRLLLLLHTHTIDIKNTTQTLLHPGIVLHTHTHIAYQFNRESKKFLTDRRTERGTLSFSV
jgi:hypothetical protein